MIPQSLKTIKTSLTKWLSVRLRTKWLGVRDPLQSLENQTFIPNIIMTKADI